jgi:hypothetical protein
MNKIIKVIGFVFMTYSVLCFSQDNNPTMQKVQFIAPQKEASQTKEEDPMIKKSQEFNRLMLTGAEFQRSVNNIMPKPYVPTKKCGNNSSDPNCQNDNQNKMSGSGSLK